MEKDTVCFDNLKTILRHIRNPQALDDHPWTKSLIVRETLAGNSQGGMAGSGQQLVNAIACLFADMQPPTPPRRGKRLDPRWGEFGLLAALYFTPYNHGTPFPTSLLDAWRRIDTAILYHVYGKPAESLTEAEIARYQLVGAEVEYGSASTLSDWHKKGLQRLADILVNRERYLSASSSKPSILLHGPDNPSARPEPIDRGPRKKYKATLWVVSLLVVCGLLILGGFKGRNIYLEAGTVYANASRLQRQLVVANDPEDLDAIYPLLLVVKNDLSSFKAEVQPLIWLSPRLGWIPVYGKDIASAPELLKIAEHLGNASDIAYQAARPLLNELVSENSDLEPAGLTKLLVDGQPQFTQARLELDQALSARRDIDPSLLSPRLRDLLEKKLDPVLARADAGLELVTTLPIVLGAAPEGPKTYLLLAQNEDELRSTGGFITSIGRLVLHNGQVISLEFEPVDNQEDWSSPYPPAPWQMRQYMNSRVILLRDANWYPDFPTTAQLAEYLYAYTHSHSVDGVIAFDQQFLVMLLQKIGPLDVDGAPGPITAENVIPYMRSAKTLPAGEPVPEGWHRKEFISDITAAIMTELMAGGGHNWRGIAGTLTQALYERHLLLQFDNPQITSLLSEQGWDNSLQPGTGDFLMVTDTNMGFNKTNAVVETRLFYDVDLVNLSNPRASLTVVHTNHADPSVPCIHWNNGQITDERMYPIDRCYWNYLRVYKQAGVVLSEAAPHAVPAEWMILGREVPARVDELEERLPGVQGYGTFLVVPGGQSLETGFQFALPPAVLSQDDSSGDITYRLRVQKQPGTASIPIEIKIVLPETAALLSVPVEAAIRENELTIHSSLRTDVEFEVVFRLP